MKTGIPLPKLGPGATTALHAVPTPPKSHAATTMKLEEPLNAVLEEEDDPAWSKQAPDEDEALDQDETLALAEGDSHSRSASRVKRQAKRLLELARKIV